MVHAGPQGSHGAPPRLHALLSVRHRGQDDVVVLPQPPRRCPVAKRTTKGVVAMKAVVFHAISDMRPHEVPEPQLHDPTETGWIKGALKPVAQAAG